MHKNIKYDKVKSIILNFYQNPEKWIDEKNKNFIEREKENEKDFFNTIESNPLTDKQKEAVIINENNNLVLAGAGSGKTSVIIAKVAYLLKKNILKSDEILILAFNKKAKDELKERLQKRDLDIRVETFHSFGLDIVSDSSRWKPDICKIANSQNELTKFIVSALSSMITKGGYFASMFTDYIAYFSIPYKSKSSFKSLGEYYAYLKSRHMTTLKNEEVKSYQELVIANFLALNDIEYKYEEPYKHDTSTKDRRQYKPDFYLPHYDIYIEHYGIDRNGNTAPYIDKKKYRESMEWKRELHKKYKTICVETFSYEWTENCLLDNLKDKLSKYGVEFKKLDPKGLNELLQKPIENRFAKLFNTFLNHYKSNRCEIGKLKVKAQDDKRKSLFLKIFEYLFKEYESYQRKNSCIDFNDMIIKAIKVLESGEFRHNYKHIFIDEFQDISTTRADFIQKLLILNNASLTAVGDDWQAINAFAGGNIKIIQKFSDRFGYTKTTALDYTFRFNNVISDIASKFIQKNPHQIKKEIKTVKKEIQERSSLYIYWGEGDSVKDLEYILDLIDGKIGQTEKSIMILARYNHLLEEVNAITNKYKKFKIEYDTIHSSKGKEADYVIVLNVNSGKYGFPSKIENDPILDLVIPERESYEDEEERRLFYVALTRAKEKVFLISNIYEQSSFIRELIDDNADKITLLDTLKQNLQHCPECKTGYLKRREDNKFYGCSNYPICTYTEKIFICPKCNNELFKDLKKSMSKCRNEECDYEYKLCPNCNGMLVKRNGQYGEFIGCENYPECTYTENISHQSKIHCEF